MLGLSIGVKILKEESGTATHPAERQGQPGGQSPASGLQSLPSVRAKSSQPEAACHQ